MGKNRRTNYALQSVRLAVSSTVNTNYPPNVKIERLRALHIVLDNFKESIRSINDWDELKSIEELIYAETKIARALLPEGTTVYF